MLASYGIDCSAAFSQPFHSLPLFTAQAAELEDCEAADRKHCKAAHSTAADTRMHAHLPPLPRSFLVEAPPNVCTPTHLAEAAAHIAKTFPSTFKVCGQGRGASREMGQAAWCGVICLPVCLSACLLSAVAVTIPHQMTLSPYLSSRFLSHFTQYHSQLPDLTFLTLQLEVLEHKECAAMGMGLYLGVAEASEEPPKFIHLTYTSPGELG